MQIKKVWQLTIQCVRARLHDPIEYTRNNKSVMLLTKP